MATEIVTGRLLSLLVSSNQWKGHVTSYELTPAARDNVTFGEAESGEPEYTLNLVVLQDLATGSAYRFLWDNAGTEGVAVKLAPRGNQTATNDKPHLTFNVTLPFTPTVGGEASQAANNRFTTTVACLVETAVTLTTS